MTHKAIGGIGKIIVKEFESYMNDDEPEESEGNSGNRETDNDLENLPVEDNTETMDSEFEEDYIVNSSADGLTAEALIIDEIYEGTVLYLSPEDYEYLFFTGGEYQIDNWDSKYEIESKVLRKVDDLISLSNKNEFDNEIDGAPQDLRDHVASLSEEEAVITTLSEYLELTWEREEVYNLYPKYSLAKLISENYNLFGLAYYTQKYSFETAEYYFGQAALWQYEALSFDEITDTTQKQLLLNISQRYKDIACVCSESDEEYEYCLALAEAFWKVANVY